MILDLNLNQSLTRKVSVTLNLKHLTLLSSTAFVCQLQDRLYQPYWPRYIYYLSSSSSSFGACQWRGHSHECAPGSSVLCLLEPWSKTEVEKWADDLATEADTIYVSKQIPATKCSLQTLSHDRGLELPSRHIEASHTLLLTTSIGMW